MAASPVLDVRESTTVPSGTSETDSALQLRTHFLRRVAHDIASPAGVTMTVLDELANTQKPPRPELIGMARRSLKRLMRLSEHLALVAELESGTLEAEVSVVDVRALTRQGLDDAVAIDGRKDVVAACDVPAAPLSVSGDPRLLAVVVREVIGNALKLASSRVEVSLKEVDGSVVLRVDDDGPGFPEEARATLGRRFVRRSSARGLGLSLSMALEILAEHGGSLEVEPSLLPPGRRGTTGTAVVVTLPKAAAAPAPR